MERTRADIEKDIEYAVEKLRGAQEAFDACVITLHEAEAYELSCYEKLNSLEDELEMHNEMLAVEGYGE